MATPCMLCRSQSLCFQAHEKKQKAQREDYARMERAPSKQSASPSFVDLCVTWTLALPCFQVSSNLGWENVCTCVHCTNMLREQRKPHYDGSSEWGTVFPLSSGCTNRAVMKALLCDLSPWSSNEPKWGTVHHLFPIEWRTRVNPKDF